MKSIITFIGVAICTALLYHLIYEEHTTLFYVNVVVTWLAEGILLLNLPLFSSTKFLDFKNAASMTVLNLAAIILLLWTIGYSFYTEDQENLENLYIGILILAIIAIIVVGATEIGGSAMKKQEAELKTTIQRKKRISISTSMFLADAKDCLHNQSDWEDETLSALKNVLDKISSIPAEKAERNEDVMSDINDKLNEIQELLNKYSTDNSDETLMLSITRKINQLKNYIFAIKVSL